MADHGLSAELTALRGEVAELRAELAEAKAEWTRATTSGPSSASGSVLGPQSAADQEEDILEHLLRPESPLNDWVRGDEIDRLLQEMEHGTGETTGGAVGGALMESIYSMAIPGSALVAGHDGRAAAEHEPEAVDGGDVPEAAPDRPARPVPGAAPDRASVPAAAAAAVGDGRGAVDGGDVPGAAPGRPARQLHLVLGDSIARDAPWRCDVIVNLARGGNTWRRQADRLDEDLACWKAKAVAEGRPRGSVVMWIGSNDVYAREGGGGVIPFKIFKIVRAVLEKLRADHHLLIIGPLPRGYDRGCRWELTRAYWLERSYKQILPHDCPFYRPGHRLTHMLRRRRGRG